MSAGNKNDIELRISDVLFMFADVILKIILDYKGNHFQGKYDKMLVGHDHAVSGIAQISDNIIVSCGGKKFIREDNDGYHDIQIYDYDKHIRIWDINTGVCLYDIIGDGYYNVIIPLKYNKMFGNDQNVAIASKNYILIINTNNGKILNKYNMYDEIKTIHELLNGKLIVGTVKNNELNFYKVSFIYAPYKIAGPFVDYKFNYKNFISNLSDDRFAMTYGNHIRIYNKDLYHKKYIRDDATETERTTGIYTLSDDKIIFGTTSGHLTIINDKNNTKKSIKIYDKLIANIIILGVLNNLCCFLVQYDSYDLYYIYTYNIITDVVSPTNIRVNNNNIKLLPDTQIAFYTNKHLTILDSNTFNINTKIFLGQGNTDEYQNQLLYVLNNSKIIISLINGNLQIFK